MNNEMKSFKKIFEENKFIFFLAILCLLFFWKDLLHPAYFLYSEYYQSDLIEQHSFWYHYIKVSFGNFGYFPLWNHHVFGGVPFFATNFSQLFYPFTLLFLLFPTDYVFAHFYMINFFLGGLSMYFLMRILKLDKFSAFIAAVVYVFNARTVAYIFSGEFMMMSVLILVPLIFLFLELSLQKNRFFYGILAAIFVSLTVLGSHLQYVFYIYFYLLLYFLFRLYYLRKESKKPFFYVKPTLIFVFIILFSILLSSIQLLPNLELSKYHIRSSTKLDYSYASTTSLPFQHLITLLIPNFFGSYLNDTYWGAYSYWSLAVYIGILPLILVSFAFLRKNKYVLFFALMAALSLLIAFGKYSPVHYILFRFVPGFNLFRVPSRILYFFIFSMSVLAGFGVDFLTTNKKILSFSLKTLVVVFAISLLSFAVILFAKPVILSYGNQLLKERYTSSTLKLDPLENYLEKVEPAYGWILSGFSILTVTLFSIIALFAFRLKNKISTKNFKILLFLIIIMDLWVYSMTYINLKDPNLIFSKNDIVNFLNNDKSYYRVMDITEYPYALPQHIAGRYNIDLTTGYDAIVLKFYYEYLGKMGSLSVHPSTTIPIKNIAYPQLADLLNVKYIISSGKLNNSRYNLTFSDDRYYIYLNKKYLPRAFIVSNAVILKNKEEILNKLSNEQFDVKDIVVLEEMPNGILQNNGHYKETPISYYSPHKITVNANLDSPAFLILSETWYPGWKAYDNGKEIKVYKADYVLRAVYLGKGEHKVDFVFDPISFKIGYSMTIAALLISFILLIVFWRYRI